MGHDTAGAPAPADKALPPPVHFVGQPGSTHLATYNFNSHECCGEYNWGRSCFRDAVSLWDHLYAGVWGKNVPQRGEQRQGPGTPLKWEGLSSRVGVFKLAKGGQPYNLRRGEWPQSVF